VSQQNQLPLFDDFEHKSVSNTQSKVMLDTDENKISLLALSEIQGVGFATIRALFNAFNGELTQVWNANRDDLYNHLRKASIPQPNQAVYQIKERTKEFYERAKGHYYSLKHRKVDIIFRGAAAYPEGLYKLKSPPSWLFVEGNTELLYDPSIVAVVGTRDPTENGLRAAKRLSVLLITQGCIILSGLAEGIDEAAHQTSVDYGVPTVAVLGHGIDVTFPAATAKLRHQVIERGGALVSEYLPKDTYNRERFVQRNRIQAALAKCVGIVEGKLKSGTAHTIRFAHDLNRPVFGVIIGLPQSIPRQELLTDLVKQKEPVFNLDSQADRNELGQYLRSQIPLEQSKRSATPQLFRGLLDEIQRLSHDYDAEESDFDWLISQIQLYRENIGGISKNDNQSNHS